MLTLTQIPKHMCQNTNASTNENENTDEMIFSHRQSATERSPPVQPIPATAKLFEQRPNLKTVSDQLRFGYIVGWRDFLYYYILLILLVIGNCQTHLHPMKALFAPLKPSILQTTLAWSLLSFFGPIRTFQFSYPTSRNLHLFTPSLSTWCIDIWKYVFVCK